MFGHRVVRHAAGSAMLRQFGRLALWEGETRPLILKIRSGLLPRFRACMFGYVCTVCAVRVGCAASCVSQVVRSDICA
eukprot:155195-Prymnesium_polylepis.1